MTIRVLVAVKRVVDPSVHIRVRADGSGIDLTNVKMSMNPFDEIALEEAVRLREAGIASDVVAVSIGPAQAQETIRMALAMGADRGVLVLTDEVPEPLAVAKVLKSIVLKESTSLVLMGKQAIDGDNNQTGQMLAALLGWPQGTFASGLAIDGDTATVRRETDQGTETLALTLPAVVTADLRLNEPRFASLPNIMKAKRRPLEEYPLESFGAGLGPRLVTIGVSQPPTPRGGFRVRSVDELVDRLRNEAGVL